MNIKFLISLIIVSIYTFFKMKKNIHMLQQNWYNEGNRYLKWIGKNLKINFITLDLSFLLLTIFFIAVDLPVLGKAVNKII